MSVVLVVERDASRSKRISEALRSGGLSVTTAASRTEALSSAEERPPSLLLASSALPEASALLADFSRSRGGPGAVVLAPAAEGASATDFQADELLAEPFSDGELRELVQRRLKTLRLPPSGGTAPDRRSGASRRSDDSEQLTSADIFGDLLAEVESEAGSSRSTPRKPTPPMQDIERRLEETLSGVIPTAGKRKRPSVAQAPGQREAGKRRAELPTHTEIDDLLDQTLSSLDIPTRLRRPPAAPAAKPTGAVPSDMESGPPEPETHSARLPDTAPLTEPAPEPARSDFEIEPEGAAAYTLPVRIPAVDAPAETAPAETAPAETAPAAAAAETAPAERAHFEPFSKQGEALSASESGAQDPMTAPDAVPDHFRTQRLPTLDPTAAASGAETFGDYTLLDRIAVGGMAEVWRARRRGVEGFQKTVAIKKILSHLTGSKDFVTMFIDEAKLAAQLSHNNIIQIYDLGKVGDDYFIAMEHVDGKDLRSLLTSAQESNRPIPLGLGLLIVSAVASALDYAHRKRDFDNRALGLVHRDVSPQNVMISYEGAIKLCDFGIVKAVAKASTTQLGALKGKLQYMSPEQAWGKSVDARSDIFSLGSVFFEVLAGTQLFSGESEIGVLDAVRECRIRSPREIVPEIPEEIDSIVLKSLAKYPEDRFQTAGELEHEIRSVLDNLRPTPSQKDLAAYMQSLLELPTSDAVAPDLPGVEQPGLEPGTEKPGADKPGAEVVGGTGRWKWIVAAVLVATLIGIGFLTLPTLLEREAATAPVAGPAAREAPPEAPAVTPAAPEADAAASIDATAGDTGGADLIDTESTGEAASGAASDDPNETDSAVTAAGIDIKQMVNEELAQRADKLQRDFEAEKKRLERELARTQKESQPSSEDGKQEDGEQEDDSGGTSGGES